MILIKTEDYFYNKFMFSPASPAVDTSVSYTGSGILGGIGAGSISYGKPIRSEKPSKPEYSNIKKKEEPKIEKPKNNYIGFSKRMIDDLTDYTNKQINENKQTLADFKAERDQKERELAQLQQDLTNAENELAAAKAQPCDYTPCGGY